MAVFTPAINTELAHPSPVPTVHNRQLRIETATKPPPRIGISEGRSVSYGLFWKYPPVAKNQYVQLHLGG